MGHKDRGQLELSIAGSLQQLVPEDHVLARVDRVFDLGWLGEEVADCYCADNGRPVIDPEVAVRLMLAGLLLEIVRSAPRSSRFRAFRARLVPIGSLARRCGPCGLTLMRRPD